MLDLSMHSLDFVLRERHHWSALVGEATSERRAQELWDFTFVTSLTPNYKPD